MTNELSTIDTLALDLVTGGASAEINANTRIGNIQGSFSSTARPDPDKQLRCFQQVASQAGWFQASRETLRQQTQLCGTLPEAASTAPSTGAR
jgi:hypothetical protein